jgi:transcriptional antiterminator RfaH
MGTIKKNRNWYALYVNVRHEKKIARLMNERGIECYVPLIKKMSQWSDRKKMVEMPLIAGYVFICIPSEEMDKPRFVNGVVNFVRFNGAPAVIRSAEMEGLKYFVENGFELDESPAEIEVGDKVIYKLENFKSFVGEIEKFQGNNYAIITFEGVAKNYKVKAAIKALRKKTA